VERQTLLMEIRVAIIGFGFMGQMHAKVYQSLPGVTVVAIADPFTGADKAADEIGLRVIRTDSLATLLSSVEFDVLDICLPTDLHAETIILAARAGKHIFCEKPLALDLEQGEAALLEVERSGVSLQVGQCIRFWPEYQALQQFMASGAGGKLSSLSMQRRAGRPSYSRDGWLLDAKRSKGAALDLHIHDTDYIHHLLGKPKAVHSIGRSENEAWTHLFTHYIFDSTAVTSEGAWDLPPRWGFQMAFQAVFENAAVDFDTLSSPTLHLTLGDGAREPMDYEKAAISTSGATKGNISELGGYYNQLAYFYGQLSEGKKPSIATGRQALESLRTVLLEIQSASTGRIITLA
jgi:predicted dehydrogenase